MKTGIANLPLHYGKAPSWLFQKMKKLAGEIVECIVIENGVENFFQKLSNPFWFQALGCVLGFDWHSSGLTTTVCGALKEGLNKRASDLGIFIAGGKGKASRNTPEEIKNFAEKYSFAPDNFVYASKMSAKVDSNALQDGYAIYHHMIFFTKSGLWNVIQQGMNEITRYARRYHWYSACMKDFVCEPHTAICCDKKNIVLNMVAVESKNARETTTFLAREKPSKIIKEVIKIQESNIFSREYANQLPLPGILESKQLKLTLPTRHYINLKRLNSVLIKTFERKPENFEQLLGTEGVGPKTIRALALISEIIYGNTLSFEDPARFSFAHGGKDGTPYPVDRENYEKSIEIIRRALQKAKIGERERLQAIKRLQFFLK